MEVETTVRDKVKDSCYVWGRMQSILVQPSGKALTFAISDQDTRRHPARQLVDPKSISVKIQYEVKVLWAASLHTTAKDSLDHRPPYYQAEGHE